MLKIDEFTAEIFWTLLQEELDVDESDHSRFVLNLVDARISRDEFTDTVYGELFGHLPPSPFAITVNDEGVEIESKESNPMYKTHGTTVAITTQRRIVEVLVNLGAF